MLKRDDNLHKLGDLTNYVYLCTLRMTKDVKWQKKDYHNRIRVVLTDKQITNRWLASQMGVTDMTVSRWKTNKIQPSMSQFVEIARLLQVDIKDLLEIDVPENLY